MDTPLSNKIIIIDYGAGNVKSLGNILEYLGYSYEITDNKEKILSAKKIIFPGQGHFEQAMSKLNAKNLPEIIKETIDNGANFLGICLGLQVLFQKSEEAPNVEGLGIFKGEVKKFQQGKIPQIGWNKIKTTNTNTYLKNDYFYFVNSYYVVPEDKSIISSITNYHIDFCSSIQKNNICAVQFHPEKSSQAGIEFFKKWLI